MTNRWFERKSGFGVQGSGLRVPEKGVHQINRPAQKWCWVLWFIVAWLAGCQAQENQNVTGSQPVSSNQNTKQYFPDLELFLNQAGLQASVSHLVMLNLSAETVDVTATAYFENQPPLSFPLKAKPNQSTETNSLQWPVPANIHFGLILESKLPLVCQVTTGWNNTNHQYGPDAVTQSPKGKRETARSTNAITRLRRTWAIADGIVLDAPTGLWIKEDEWLLLLNPGKEPAHVRLDLMGPTQTPVPEIMVPAERLKRVQMSGLVVPNQNYGVRVTSSNPIAVQWLRHVYWYDSDELMACWSIPGVPLNE